jgi:hypothetical protein
MRFTTQDVDEWGVITQAAVNRECALLRLPYTLNAQWVHQLYILARQAPASDTVEVVPEGVYAEVQLGRHVEHKLMFRFAF